MLVDLSNAVGDYLHDVFVARFDWWVLLGFVAQAFSPCASWCSGSPPNASARA